MDTSTFQYHQPQLDYSNVIFPKIKTILDGFSEENIKITVRGMFYQLVSYELIDNTYNDYKRLDSALTRARKNGIIPKDAFVDNTRTFLDVDDTYISPQSFVDIYINVLKNAYDHYKIPRWYNQPHYVEVWLEKDTMLNTFHSILKDKQVRIISNHGWSSYSYIENNIKRLRQILYDTDKEIHILYFGDYDPSGLSMDRWIENRLKLALRGQIDFKRIGILKEHIREFNLQHLQNTTPKVLEKLRKDPNRHRFKDDNDAQLFQIELEALQINGAKPLKKLLSCVDEYFDKQVYTSLLNRHSKRILDNLVREGAMSLLN